MLAPTDTTKLVTVYDRSGEVIASFYGAVTLTDEPYATLFEDAGHIYMVRLEPG